MRRVLEQDLTLNEGDVHLQDVVVTARRNEAGTQARTELSGANLDRTRGQSLGEALKAVAGVTTPESPTTAGSDVRSDTTTGKPAAIASRPGIPKRC